MRIVWMLLAAVLVAALAAAVLLKRPLNGASGEELQDKAAAAASDALAVNVKIELVVSQPELTDEITLPAVVEANRVVSVSAEVSCKVEKILMAEGSRCRTGDLLVELNADLMRAEHDSAVARAKLAAANHRRIVNLHEKGSTTDRDVDQAEADLAIGNAAADIARERLERCRIAAPIDGTLNSIPVEVGEFVAVGQPVAQIVDTQTVKVVVNVPERDVQYMQTGAHAAVLAEVKGEEREFTGTITYVSELADEGTRATRTEISVDNSSRLLHSGRIVRARLTRRVLTDVIMVPLTAVIPEEHGRSVYVVNSRTALRRDVTLGLIKGQRVQILSGLEPGDRLIVAGHRFVSPGQAVKLPEDWANEREPENQMLGQ